MLYNYTKEWAYMYTENIKKTSIYGQNSVHSKNKALGFRIIDLYFHFYTKPKQLQYNL
jgi:hypothetical protein